MDQKTCKTCVHYRQHYAFNQRMIFQVYCGHCTYPKIKSKRPDTKACAHYSHSNLNEEAFVTKEYLSKALLEYMLKLELLPEIHDTAY